MLDLIQLDPSDRILFLGIRDTDLILKLASQNEGVLFTGVGSASDVRAARRDARDMPNVMFTPAVPGEIPWRDEFFTKVVDPTGEWVSQPGSIAEILRVLAENGLAAVRETAAVRKALEDASMRLDSAFPGWLLIRKESPPLSLG